MDSVRSGSPGMEAALASVRALEAASDSQHSEAVATASASVGRSRPAPSDHSVNTGRDEPAPSRDRAGQSGVVGDIAAAAGNAALGNARNAAQNTPWFSNRNLFFPIVDSAGFSTFAINAIKATAFIGRAEGERSWNENYLMNAAMSRSQFREVMFVSWGMAGWNLIETIFWLVAGIICIPFGMTEAAQEALRSAIKTVTNVFFAAIGLIGCCSPKHAYKAFGWTAKLFLETFGGSIDSREINRVLAAKVADMVVGVQAIAVTAIGDDVPGLQNALQGINETAEYRALQQNVNTATLMAFTQASQARLMQAVAAGLQPDRRS